MYSWNKCITYGLTWTSARQRKFSRILTYVFDVLINYAGIGCTPECNVERTYVHYLVVIDYHKISRWVLPSISYQCIWCVPYDTGNDAIASSTRAKTNSILLLWLVPSHLRMTCWPRANLQRDEDSFEHNERIWLPTNYVVKTWLDPQCILGESGRFLVVKMHLFEQEESVYGILRKLDDADTSDNGKFFDYTRKELSLIDSATWCIGSIWIN